MTRANLAAERKCLAVSFFGGTTMTEALLGYIVKFNSLGRRWEDSSGNQPASQNTSQIVNGNSATPVSRPKTAGRTNSIGFIVMMR
jgi:hypothetical protein